MQQLLYRSRRQPLYSDPSKPTILLLIDAQHDFCRKTGSLYVPGAEEDCDRISKMIYDHCHEIDEIIVTLDTHNRNHIAHASFWTSSKICDGGIEPEPFQQIFHKEVNIKWFPKDPSLRDHCEKYTKELESLPVKRILTIWPEHCLIGSEGHCVDSVIEKALGHWANSHPDRDIAFIHKGMNCLTEMYSAIRADVPNIDPQTQTNQSLLEDIRKAKKLIICGEASSHCVNYTTRDIVKDWEENDYDLSRIKILKDGASPVAGFQNLANEFHEDMLKKGVSIVTIDEAFSS